MSGRIYSCRGAKKYAQASEPEQRAVAKEAARLAGLGRPTNGLYETFVADGQVIARKVGERSNEN